MPKPKAKPVKIPEPEIKAVDRQFYELTIADLTKKLCTLRSASAVCETRNVELEEHVRAMNEDRTDVTSYLNRTLRKNQALIHDLRVEIADWKARLSAEQAASKRQELEDQLRYKQMQDELTSELKIQMGAVNSLNAFRDEKLELLAKYDAQEEQLRVQTKHFRDIIYNAERQQLTDKTKMKTEVERRLLELSAEFSRSNEIRISAHMQRMARENMAVNNELDRMCFTVRSQQKATKAIEERNACDTQAMASIVSENRHLVRTSEAQLNIVRRLTGEFERVRAKNGLLAEADRLRSDAVNRQTDLARKHRDLERDAMLHKQLLHSARAECAQHRTLCNRLAAKISQLFGIIRHMRMAIKSAERGELSMEDYPAFRANQRKNLLHDLMAILRNAYEPMEGVASVATVSSMAPDSEQLPSDWSGPTADRVPGQLAEALLSYSMIIEAESGTELDLSESSADARPPSGEKLEAEQGDEGVSSSDEGLPPPPKPVQAELIVGKHKTVLEPEVTALIAKEADYAAAEVSEIVGVYSD